MADRGTTRSPQTAAADRLPYFRGSLVGALVGDCLGSKYEGDLIVKLKSLLKYCEKIESVCVPCTNDNNDPDAVHTDQIPKILYTDDTAMLRSIAESLIEHKSFNAKDMAKRFVDSFFADPNRGYGGNVINVFEQLRDQQCEDPYKPAREQFSGSGSYGNGGAMRIAPAALYTAARTEDELQMLTQDITLITHSHRNGIVGAILESFAIRYALNGPRLPPTPSQQQVLRFTSDFLDKLEGIVTKVEIMVDESETSDSQDGACVSKNMETDDNSLDLPKGPYVNKINLLKKLLLNNYTSTVDIHEVVNMLGHDVSALNSVPTAVYCFLRALSPIDGIPDKYNAFGRCIILSICMGGDTDTIASMSGAISGAYHGLDVIPMEWQKVCEGLQDALRMSAELCGIAYSHGTTNLES